MISGRRDNTPCTTDFSQYGTPSKECLELSSKIPAPQANLSVAERRDYLNVQRERRSAEELEPLAPMVRSFDHTIPTRDDSCLQARTYLTVDFDEAQPLPVFLYFHGGGFFTGTVASEDVVCSRVAINTKTVVVNVCYRHTPEHTYPTAWNDAEDASEWLHDHIDDLGGDSQRVIVGGISSGAYIAASLVLGRHLNRPSVFRPPIAGQILMVPSLITIDCYEPMIRRFEDPLVCSLSQNKDAPLLSMSTFRSYTELLQIKDPDERDLRLNPGHASVSQVVGLPPTVCGVAGLDFLRDEGLLFAKTLSDAGVPIDVHMFPGLSEIERWNQVMDDGIKWVLSKPPASGLFNIKTG